MDVFFKASRNRATFYFFILVNSKPNIFPIDIKLKTRIIKIVKNKRNEEQWKDTA